MRIDLILETTAEEGGALHGPVGAAAAFRAIRQDATFWTWSVAQRPAIGASRAALQAKLVAAEERVALLGSANLTDKALALTLELGVIIRDPEVVRRMVRHFRSLMRPGEEYSSPCHGSTSTLLSSGLALDVTGARASVSAFTRTGS